MASKSRWLKWLKRTFAILAFMWLLICAIMYFFQEKLLFRPKVIAQSAAWNYDLGDEKPLEMDVKEVFLASEFEGNVNALHFKARNSKGVVLYMHGNGGNIQTYLKRRNYFLGNGWDVMLMDYRGFGKSTGPLSEAGLDADVEACWQHLSHTFPEKDIIVYGHSLGSGFATRLAAKHHPKMLILETPYTSLADVGQWQYPWLPVRYLIKYPSESKAHVAKLDCPVYVFHGTDDHTIPYSQGKTMAETAKDGHLITCEGGGHNDCAKYPQYGATLNQILR